jgi:hypothetical protein
MAEQPFNGNENPSSQGPQAGDGRRQMADELYDALVSRGYSFWDHIYPMFLLRDITRYDIRSLVRRGLATTRGNYRTLLDLFGMPPEDYKRFLNFLAAHGCRPDFREFRKPRAESQPLQRGVLPSVDLARHPRAAADLAADRSGAKEPSC